jgi:hypothetical protein
MAENKTKPTTISVPAFLEACTDVVRRTDAKALANLMQKVTGKESAMWGPSIVGFDSYHYTYESGRQGDMLILGFSRARPQTFCTAQLALMAPRHCSPSSANTPPVRVPLHQEARGCGHEVA